MSYIHQDGYNNGDPSSMDMVPRWFEMLKELRNGTISYIQLIKREQIRPPVRPVCRRLGVAKLSDIVSEDILYRAIVQVAESQSQGLRAARAEDNNESDLGLQGSGLGSGLGLDMSSMNLHGQGQGQYSSHPSTGSNWNNQSQSQLRSQRNTFDGVIGRGGMNNQGSHVGSTNRSNDQHYQQPQHSKGYDQQRLSFQDSPHQPYQPSHSNNYNDRDDYDLYGHLTSRSDGAIPGRDSYEIQGYGQQLFNSRDNLNLNLNNVSNISGGNGNGNGNMHGFNNQNDNSHLRTYRSEISHSNSQSSIGSNKSSYSSVNRSTHNIQSGINPSLSQSLSPRGLGSSQIDIQTFSPMNSPRSPRLGFSLNNPNVRNTANLGPGSNGYNYSQGQHNQQQFQNLHSVQHQNQNQNQNQNQMDSRQLIPDQLSPRSFSNQNPGPGSGSGQIQIQSQNQIPNLVHGPGRMNNNLNVNIGGISPPNNYTVNHGINGILVPNQGSVGGGVSGSSQNNSGHLQNIQNIQSNSLMTKYSFNGTNQAPNPNPIQSSTQQSNQFILGIPSPRTTSFMPFGSATQHHGLNGEYSLSTDSESTFSPTGQDELSSFGEYVSSPRDFDFKLLNNSNTSPLQSHTSRDYDFNNNVAKNNNNNNNNNDNNNNINNNMNNNNINNNRNINKLAVFESIQGNQILSSADTVSTNLLPETFEGIVDQSLEFNQFSHCNQRVPTQSKQWGDNL